MKQGVTATKELHEILRERANYEEAFSKSLQKLSLRASTITTVGWVYLIECYWKMRSCVAFENKSDLLGFFWCNSYRILTNNNITLLLRSFYPIWLVINDYIEKMSKIHGKFADRFRELCTELNQYLEMTAKTNKSVSFFSLGLSKPC